MRLIISFMLLGISFIGFGQSTALDELLYIGDVMINASKPEHRVRAHNEFLPKFKSLLEDKEANNMDLSTLEWVSEHSASNGSFRLFTWQIVAGDDDYRYYGFILKQDGTLYELQDKKSELEDLEYLALSPDEWYGSVYYGMKEYAVDGKIYYMLTGYNGHTQYDKIKTAEVMYFDDDGTPIIGLDCWRFPQEGIRDKIQNRIILTYSADSNVSLRYNDNLDIMMHDHLIRRMGQFAGQGPTNVSDGSYEGYELTNGEWVYNEKIFHHKYNVNEAPRPKPVLGGAKKGIFGKG